MRLVERTQSTMGRLLTHLFSGAHVFVQGSAQLPPLSAATGNPEPGILFTVGELCPLISDVLDPCDLSCERATAHIPMRNFDAPGHVSNNVLRPALICCLHHSELTLSLIVIRSKAVCHRTGPTKIVTDDCDMLNIYIFNYIGAAVYYAIIFTGVAVGMVTGVGGLIASIFPRKKFW